MRRACGCQIDPVVFGHEWTCSQWPSDLTWRTRFQRAVTERPVTQVRSQ